MLRRLAAAPSLLVAGLLLFMAACGSAHRPATNPGEVSGAAGAPRRAPEARGGAGLAAEARPAGLSPAFHRGRREALRQRLPPNSVAVFFAAPPRLLAADVDYPFHQDPDFFYLTGLREPGAVLLLFAEAQPAGPAGGPPITEQLYVRPRDAYDEQWNGPRLGPAGAARILAFGAVYPSTQFVARPPDLSRFARVCWLLPRPGEDGRQTPTDSTELPDLRAAFERAARLPAAFNAPRTYALAKLRERAVREPNRPARWFEEFVVRQPLLLAEPAVRAWAVEPDSVKRQRLATQYLATLPGPGRFDLTTLDNALNELREIKQPEELALLRYAIGVTVKGHREVLKALTPEQSEADLDGLHQLVFRHYLARADGYWPIVGSGANGCVLHYIENNRPRLGNDLVVMDVGAAYEGYTADVTRTAPATGTFSPEQRLIYELVLAAQEAGIRACRPGRDFYAPGQAAQKIIGAGLVKLGLISVADSAARYFPHGTSHYLGLDVHDRGTYGPLRPNSVITVEPGIYIPPGSPCDRRWWGIGCRIEDDILITEKAPENLSSGVPRTVPEVEALIAEPSIWEQWRP